MPAKIVIVTPAPGLVVRDPKTMQALPPEGKRVELSSHWTRRRAQGDVTIADAPAAKPAKSGAKE